MTYVTVDKMLACRILLRLSVHRDGDYHRAVHVWIYSESTHELLLQRRSDCKDSWPGMWDISSAGHISAGDSSLVSARRELEEELGVTLPMDAFELLFVFLQECVINDGTFINNEYNDVYLVTTLAPIPLEAFTLQDSEVSAVKYIACDEYRELLSKEDPDYVPYALNEQYGQLFNIIGQRYKQNAEERSLALQKQLNRYASISLSAELDGVSDADKEALKLLVKASRTMDDIFHEQVRTLRTLLVKFLRLLHSKADAFLSNDYYESDIAWMELDSKLDVTIGPYETYEDMLFGYKATFEAFIGVRDDEATAQLKLFGDQLLVLEQNLPMDDSYKSKHVISAPIRVIRLLYNAGIPNSANRSPTNSTAFVATGSSAHHGHHHHHHPMWLGSSAAASSSVASANLGFVVSPRRREKQWWISGKATASS
ncbi:hypothetical protein V2J09_003037 [Rumex salicifolius]